jgi:hypothetical protein
MYFKSKFIYTFIGKNVLNLVYIKGYYFGQKRKIEVEALTKQIVTSKLKEI